MYDWEESQSHDVAYVDAFYYVVAPVLHSLAKVDVEDILRSAIRLASKIDSTQGLDNDDFEVYFNLSLLQCHCRDDFRAQIVSYFSGSIK